MFNLKISRSLIAYVSISALLVLIYSFIFIDLMHTYESKDYDFITATYWVIVSMTTVGYGEIIFQSHIGQLFTIVVVLSGVVMIFGYLFPLVVTPQLEKTLRRELPSRVPVDFKNHIIICGHNQLVETLIGELDENRIPFVVIDENEHTIHPVSYTHLRAHETRHDLVCR